VDLDRLEGVVRARRVETTRRHASRRQALVETNEAQQHAGAARLSGRRLGQGLDGGGGGVLHMGGFLSQNHT
jgi:hypothetical protein